MIGIYFYNLAILVDRTVDIALNLKHVAQIVQDGGMIGIEPGGFLIPMGCGDEIALRLGSMATSIERRPGRPARRQPGRLCTTGGRALTVVGGAGRRFGRFRICGRCGIARRLRLARVLRPVGSGGAVVWAGPRDSQGHRKLALAGGRAGGVAGVPTNRSPGYLGVSRGAACRRCGGRTRRHQLIQLNDDLAEIEAGEQGTAAGGDAECESGKDPAADQEKSLGTSRSIGIDALGWCGRPIGSGSLLFSLGAREPSIRPPNHDRARCQHG